MTIIDAHHHIWRHAHTPWLNGPALPRIFGDYEALRQDYLAQDFIDDVVPQGVVSSVYIQVNVGPGDEVAEIEWVASVAREHGFPQASVGYADLSAPRSTGCRQPETCAASASNCTGTKTRPTASPRGPT